ncbi:hypothetical protein F4803DRAFT_556388 [Xylaria telfairii]|nr:hypothetical protein F4803DRAFT_556388 [Xylaria telfairii]
MESSHEEQALDSMSKPAATSSQPQDIEVGFKYFSKLPAELQLMIWELAIPARVLNVWNYYKSPTTMFLTPWRGTPEITKACHDSRQLARRSGDIKIFGSLEIGGESRCWFDSRRDAIRISEKATMDYLPKCVEKLVCSWLCLLFCRRTKPDINFAKLPNLRSVQYEVRWLFLPSEIWDTWEFANGRERVSTILLDVDDEDEVQRFANMLRNRSDWQYSRWFEEIGCLRDEKFRISIIDEGEDWKDWKVAKKQLEDKWMEDHQRDIESAAGHPKTKSHHAKIPKFSRVISLVAFPEHQYKDGASYYGKDRFLLFDVKKKPKQRVIQVYNEEDNVERIESFIAWNSGFLPLLFSSMKRYESSSEDENSSEDEEP